MSLLVEFWPYIAAALAFVGGALGLYGKGRSDAKKKHKARKAEADEKTHDRINKVDPVDPLDRGDILDRLREHGGQ